MIYDYHIHVIRSFVDKNVTNISYIRRKAYPFTSMKDIQKSLYRAPVCQKDLANDPKRKTILMPIKFLDFALKELKNHSVILMITTKHEALAMKSCPRLPSNFHVFNLVDSIQKVKIPKKSIDITMKKANRIIHKHRNHEIFGTKRFKNMLPKKLVHSMKLVHVLQSLIVNKKIKVIMDHTEYTSSGNILSLLAHKYNLSFLNIQYFLTSDVSMVPSRASYYCVWGKNTKKWLETKGIAGPHVIPVGSLRFEMQHIPSKLKKRSEINNKLNIHKKNYIITLITQDYSKNTNLAIMNWIIKVIPLLPAAVVIKPHRRDKLDYSRFLQKQKIVLASPDIHLYDLIKNTDYLMTISSNVAIEAAMYEKCILVLQPNMKYDYIKNYNNYYRHLAKADAGIIIENEKNLYHTLSKLIKSKSERQKTIQKGQIFLNHTLHPDSCPSVCIREIIQKIL